MNLTRRLAYLLRHPWRAARIAVSRLRHRIRSRRWPPVGSAALPDLEAIRRRARDLPEALSDHMETLFVESLLVRPRLIVELGMRRGASTCVLERVARRTGAHLVSVDIAPAEYRSDWERWHFVQADDVAFAPRFEAWCREQGLDPAIDVLFIDTNHEYEHTRAEIAGWFPLLAARCKVFFHDTNMGTLHPRKDGRITGGWDNRRGVIRALEEHFGTRWNEHLPFVDLRDGWLIRHHPYASGFTVLERTGEEP